MKGKLQSLIVAYFWGVFGSLVCFPMLLTLFSGYLSSSLWDILFAFGVGVFLSFFIAFGLCICFFIPILLFDKRKLSEFSFQDLLERYLPCLGVPFAFILCFLLFGIDVRNGDGYYPFIYLIHLIILSYISLWKFLKYHKS